ncbi:unnamed protein product, partial [Gadus morhua 'NCC']
MTTSPEDSILLQNAQNKIAYLTDDIRRLSAELRKKEAILSSFSETLREKELLLSSFTDIATDQSKQISTLSAALQDTVLWDPSGIRAPVSSTPGPQPWTEVIVRDRRRHTRAVIPALPLGNRLLQEAVSRRSAPEAELPKAEPDGASPLQPSVEQPLQGASGTTATTH